MGSHTYMASCPSLPFYDGKSRPSVLYGIEVSLYWEKYVNDYLSD